MKKLKTCEYCQNEFNPKESHSQLYCSSQCLYQGKRRKTLETNRKRYGCDAPAQNPQIKQKVKSYFVEKFGVENPFQNQQIKEKIKKTNLLKLGVQNPQQNQKIKQKTEKTNIKRYGCKRPAQNKQVKEKTRQYFLSKFGVKNPFQNQQIKQKIKKKTLQNYGVQHSIVRNRRFIKNVSKLELVVENILLTENVDFERQFPIDKYYYDFRVGDILIQVQGDFWHANPDIYSQNKLLNYPRIGQKTAKEVWGYDQQKKVCAQGYGYKVIYVWEKDMKSMSKEQLIETIRRYL